MPKVLASFLRTREGAITKKQVPKVRECFREQLDKASYATIDATLRELCRSRGAFQAAADRLDRSSKVSRWAGGRLMKIYDVRMSALEAALPRAAKTEQKLQTQKLKAKAKEKAKKAKEKAKEKAKKAKK